MSSVIEINHIDLKGITACVPKEKECSKDYTGFSPDETNKFIRITGIEERRIAPKNTSALDLGIHALNNLILQHHLNPAEIDILLVVSQTREYIMPQMAHIIQQKCGLRNELLCFDIPAGCAGFNLGLSIVGNLLEAGKYKKAVLICTDTTSKATFYNDKAIYPILGDAAIASLFEYNETASPIYYQHFSDGSGAEYLIIPYGAYRSGYDDATLPNILYEDGIERPGNKVFINGNKIFEFAVGTIPSSISKFLESANTPIQHIDYFVLHQANKIINETIRKQLRQEAEKFPMSISVFGNTSSASIPITILFALNKVQPESFPLKLLLCGFGVGLSWSNVLININETFVFGKIEEI